MSVFPIPSGSGRLHAALAVAGACLAFSATSALAQNNNNPGRGPAAADPRAPVSIPAGPLADDATPIALRAVRPRLALKTAIRGGETICRTSAAARRDREEGISVVTYGTSIRYRSVLSRCAS